MGKMQKLWTNEVGSVMEVLPREALVAGVTISHILMLHGASTLRADRERRRSRQGGRNTYLHNGHGDAEREFIQFYTKKPIR